MHSLPDPSAFSASTAALPELPCFLNGVFTRIGEAKVSVMDRGFIFGDGIYEVVPVYGGRPFRFDQHMARLSRSLRELRIPNPLTPDQWQELVRQLIVRFADSTGTPAAQTDQLVYIQVTRGVAMRDHVMPAGILPTLFAMVNTMRTPSAEQFANGVACVTADDFRWQKAHVKSTSLLGSVLSRQISFDAGAMETVMFRDGCLSEAAASNVWVVKDGTVLGSPKDNLVLEGIRYGLIEKMCRAIGVPFALRRITREEVLDADELLLSSATKEVLSITTLDGHPVGHASHRGRRGPVSVRLHAAYQAAKQAHTG
jgi:D-alanine transaminase